MSHEDLRATHTNTHIRMHTCIHRCTPTHSQVTVFLTLSQGSTYPSNSGSRQPLHEHKPQIHMQHWMEFYFKVKGTA